MLKPAARSARARTPPSRPAPMMAMVVPGGSEDEVCMSISPSRMTAVRMAEVSAHRGIPSKSQSDLTSFEREISVLMLTHNLFGLS